MVLIIEPSTITGRSGDTGFLSRSFSEATDLEAYPIPSLDTKNLEVIPNSTASDLLRDQRERQQAGSSQNTLDGTGRSSSRTEVGVVRGGLGIRHNDGNGGSAYVSVKPGKVRAGIKLEF